MWPCLLFPFHDCKLAQNFVIALAYQIDAGIGNEIVDKLLRIKKSATVVSS